MHRDDRDEEKVIIGVVSFFLLFVVFLTAYSIVLSKENAISKIQKEKEVIEDCLRVLLQDCRQKCKTFIGEDVLFVSKECDGKGLKNAWLSMSNAKAYFDGKSLRWSDGLER